MEDLKKSLGSFFAPFVGVIILIIVYYLIKYGLRAYTLRNVGYSTGSGDFSNLATELYNVYDSWFSSPDDIEKVASRVNALDDANLAKLNDKFVKLYGDKCRGGGLFCSDTTSLLSFTSSYSCAFSVCNNHNEMVQRLKSILL